MVAGGVSCIYKVPCNTASRICAQRAAAVAGVTLADTRKIPLPLVPSHPCSGTSMDVSSQARAAAASGAPGRFFFSRRLGSVPLPLFSFNLGSHSRPRLARRPSVLSDVSS